MRKIDEPRWAWHIGLDAESTAILNELWAGERGRARAHAQHPRAFSRCEFDDPAAMRADIARPDRLSGARRANDGVVTMKPQNLLTNLPLR